MFTTIILLLAILATVAANAPSTTKVSAAVKDTSVNGFEGLNVNVAAPFKFQDYVVGFKYALGNIKRAPESLFAKRSFDTSEGQFTVDSDYNIADNTLGVSASWNSDSLGLNINAVADSKDRVTEVGFKKDTTVDNNKLTLSGAYDLLKKKFSASSSFTVDSTTVNVDYNSADKDPVLSVTSSIDSKNEISPSISLKSGDVSYGYTRKWDGGSLASKFFPGDKVAMEWTDNGSSGTWTTTAEMPLDDRSNTKISFARDWDY